MVTEVCIGHEGGHNGQDLGAPPSATHVRSMSGLAQAHGAIV